MPDYPTPSSVELRARLDARERSIQQHLSTLEHEVTTVSDVTVAGRPLPDAIRSGGLLYPALVLAGGLAIGLLLGLRKRGRKQPERPEHDEFLRLYVASVVDAAARRVARGEETDAAIEKTLRRRPPLVYYRPTEPERRGALAEAWEIFLSTAFGFGVKVGLDALGQRLTGEPELFDAVREGRQEQAP